MRELLPVLQETVDVLELDMLAADVLAEEVLKPIDGSSEAESSLGDTVEDGVVDGPKVYNIAHGWAESIQRAAWNEAAKGFGGRGNRQRQNPRGPSGP